MRGGTNAAPPHLLNRLPLHLPLCRLKIFQLRLEARQWSGARAGAAPPPRMAAHAVCIVGRAMWQLVPYPSTNTCWLSSMVCPVLLSLCKWCGPSLSIRDENRRGSTLPRERAWKLKRIMSLYMEDF
jgi:hypothetical protein